MKILIDILILAVVLVAGCIQNTETNMQQNNTTPVVNYSMITLEGKDFSEIDRLYTDLDLAVDKMLLVLMLEDADTGTFYELKITQYDESEGERHNVTEEIFYVLDYAGDRRHFRADLNEANLTHVYPDEGAIKDVLLNPEVYKINIAYFHNETENPFFLADTFEIVNKLTIIYRNLLGTDVETFELNDGSTCLTFYPEKYTRCFNSLLIDSIDELSPTEKEPVILLLGPSHTNKTAVTVS
ncbi:MAG: hypothetical protein ABIE55_03250 [Candidatus Aenigmatarchaeota archaeon]